MNVIDKCSIAVIASSREKEKERIVNQLCAEGGQRLQNPPGQAAACCGHQTVRLGMAWLWGDLPAHMEL